MNFVAFHYLYRDYSNYKRHNCVYFSNPNNLSIEQIAASIRTHLIDGECFVRYQWNVPDLHFKKTDWENDRPWHEFSCFELVETPNEKVIESIDDFLLRISRKP